MRVPLSWLRELVAVDAEAREIARRLTEAGLKVEHVDQLGGDVEGVVVARVVAMEELTGFKKPIRWVTLDDGSAERQVICGATNFAVDDLVAYARPPALLPGGFRIEARKAYGHLSDGMICSQRELGLGADHEGILVLGRSGDPALDPGLALGADVRDALGLRDTVLDLAVNPDRGYALSIRGVGREVATAFDVAFRDPADVAVPAASGAGYPVRIDAPDGCDRYVARLVDGLDPAAASPQWLQRRLTLAGMRPVSLAVDVTNHVMLELGQPLHAFDRSKLTGGIVVRRARAGERIVTLDGVDRALEPGDLVIADDTGPVALAGVMGGAATEIDAATTEILLESAHFDPVSVAYTARRHRLPSEASRRYERGVDQGLAAAAAQVAADLLARLGGADVAGPATDVDLRPAPAVLAFDPALVSRVTGVEHAADRVQRRLADVGCEVDTADPVRWRVTPPSWRPDLRRPVDLVEEVARLEGYGSVPARVPAAPAGRGLTVAQRRRRQLGRALAGAGLVEVVGHPFVAGDVGDRLGLPPGDERRPAVRLASPVSEEEPYLRAALLPGLLASLTRNVGRGAADVALFELGSVFRPAATATPMPRPPAGTRPGDDVLAAMEAALPAQPLHLALVAAGQWERAGWWGPGRAVCWADAVEAARVAAGAIGVELAVAAAGAAPWHPGRCAALLVDGAVVGHAGELHPRVVAAFDLPPRTVAAELAVDPLLAAAPDLVTAPVLSTYPAASVDVALVVPADVPAGDVARVLRAGAGPLLEQLRLFDVYVGPQLPAGTRSLAYTLRLRAPDRTLTVEEATAVRDAAVAAARVELGAQLRT